MKISKKRILIADDEQNITETLHRLFTGEGWDVQTTDSGIDAVKIVKKFYPNIILLDIKMPKRDGIETCRLIRNDLSITEQVPIIMITGEINHTNMNESIKAGCNDISLKPLDTDELMNKIEKHLKVTEPPA